MATKKTDLTGVAGASGGSAAKGPPSPKAGSTQAGAAAKGAAKGVKSSGPPKSGGATKSVAKRTAGATGTGAARKTGPRTPDLRSDARAFAAGRPDGWNHDDWLGFLESLRERGHSIEDKEAIGFTLERERLGTLLEKIPGIGAQRVRAIAERYGNVWRLKEASPDELAREANIPRPLAQRIVESIR